jgi:hypothetical protein
MKSLLIFNFNFGLRDHFLNISIFEFERGYIKLHKNNEWEIKLFVCHNLIRKMADLGDKWFHLIKEFEGDGFPPINMTKNRLGSI